MKPKITYSTIHKDYEVELSPTLTICIDAVEFSDPAEAIEQAMLWELYSESGCVK